MTPGSIPLLPIITLVLAESALLLALVKLVDRYAPAHWVRERHDLALAAVVLVPLLMVLCALPGETPRPELSTTVLPALEVPSEVRAPAAPASTMAPLAYGTRSSNPGSDRPYNQIILAVWLLGVLAMALRLAMDMRAISRLLGTSELLGHTSSLRLSRVLEVRTSDSITSPMLVGLLHPRILVPTGFALTDDAAPVLEHEIAHARRGDNWITLLQRLIGAAFWWNVPLHHLTAFITRTRESLCDRDAAVLTGAPKRLAHALLNTAATAARLPRQHVQTQRLAAHAHGPGLEERVRQLSAPDAAQQRTPRATLALILPTLAGVAYLLTPALGTAAPEDEDREADAVLEGLSSFFEGSRANLPLYEAARAGDKARVTALLDRGFDPSAAAAGDGTPLMGAIRGRHGDVVRTLLAAGADPNVPSPGDGTALIAAVRKGDRATVKLLLQAGARPDVTVPGDGAALISAAAANNLGIIDELLGAGADPNVRSGGDGSPLIAAALRGNVEATRRLLAAGADANGYVLGDETPLINAAQQGHLAVGKVLVEQGADVSMTVRTRRGTWRSPLSQARDRGHPKFVAWLESLGAAHEPGR